MVRPWRGAGFWSWKWLAAAVVCSLAAYADDVVVQPAQKDRVLIVVIDGLRPDYVRSDWMPRLDDFAESGARGLAHHAVFPTVTRVNGPAIFTGRAPGGNGALGNSVYMPDVAPDRVLDAGDATDLRLIDQATGGRLLTTPSLGEILDDNGLVYFAASSGSTGSGLLMNHTGAGAGLVHHAFTVPDTLSPIVEQLLGPLPTSRSDVGGMPLVARAIDAILEIGLDRADADVLAVWFTEPDGTAHASGVGAPETVQRLAEVDRQFGRLLDGLGAREVLDETTVLVTSDHGFSQRTGHGSLRSLLVEAGLKSADNSMDVVVAGDAIHVLQGGAERRDAIVRRLQQTDWIGPVFTQGSEGDRDLGVVAGTGSFASVGWRHDRSSDILTSPNWTDAENAWGFGGVVTSSGVAGHGSSSPWDIQATFIAGGTRVRAGLVLTTPTGNVDLTPTVLHLIHAGKVPSFDGRVLTEILVDGPEGVDVERDSVVTETLAGATHYRMVVQRSQVGGTIYFGGTDVERTAASRRFEETARFSSPHARQGPAVDEEHFYAINNRAIGKYTKETGTLVSEWAGAEDGPIIHLNSGIVFDGVLYAAHSNYPDVPMVSSIEMWETQTMRHIGSHSFGIFQGSATWIDRRDGVWWVAFANYEGRGGQPGRDPGWTNIVRFDDQWRPMGGYIFPPEVVRQFADRSNSGGAWGPDGLLYITGHDLPEIYVLEPPEAGSVMRLIERVPVSAEGQGIAWDRSRPGTLYTIVKARNEVVVSEMKGRD